MEAQGLSKVCDAIGNGPQISLGETVSTNKLETRKHKKDEEQTPDSDKSPYKILKEDRKFTAVSNKEDLKIDDTKNNNNEMVDFDLAH